MDREKRFIKALERLRIDFGKLQRLIYPPFNTAGRQPWEALYFTLIEQINQLFHPEPFQRGDMLLRTLTLTTIKKRGPIETTLTSVAIGNSSVYRTNFVNTNYIWLPNNKVNEVVSTIIQYRKWMKKKVGIDESARCWWYLPLVVFIFEECGLFQREEQAIALWKQETDDILF